MDHYENFKPRCTMDEAKKLKGEIPYGSLCAIYNCYKEICENKLLEPDFNGICAVFALGFLSGFRACKERKRVKHDNRKSDRNS